jgi:hypothetical protein
MKYPLNRLRAFPLKGDDSLAAGRRGQPRPLLAVSGESVLGHTHAEGNKL